jgi:hypothetical protein
MAAFDSDAFDVAAFSDSAFDFGLALPDALYETIPYLIGAEEYSARQMLSSIYMVVSVVGSGGTVTAQSVAAFTQALRGTTVEITMGGAIHVPPRAGRGGQQPYGASIS